MIGMAVRKLSVGLGRRGRARRGGQRQARGGQPLRLAGSRRRASRWRSRR